jgi:hypothetical protein
MGYAPGMNVPFSRLSGLEINRSSVKGGYYVQRSVDHMGTYYRFGYSGFSTYPTLHSKEERRKAYQFDPDLQKCVGRRGVSVAH